MTETVKLQLDKNTAEKFREAAMRTFGHSKGAISKAGKLAVDLWLMRIEIPSRKMSAYDFLGIAKDIKMTSLEAQEYAKNLMIRNVMKNVSSRR